MVEFESDSGGGGRLPRVFCMHAYMNRLTEYLYNADLRSDYQIAAS